MENTMKELIKFLQDIFMIKETAPQSVGLSQFKRETAAVPPKKAEKKQNKEIKLSDLMRRN